MELSTSELQHYTKSKEILVSILNNGFYPAFCKERYSDDDLFYLPIVCFCDIPWKLSSEHRNWYGDYMIAMKPEWALSNNIHPVHYIREPKNEKHNLNSAYNCIIKNYMGLTMTEVNNTIDIINNNILKERSNLFQYRWLIEFTFYINHLLYPLSLMQAYQKPFEGYQINPMTGNEVYKKFYDEKEWRYIPYLEDLNDYFKNVFFDYFFEYAFINKGFSGFHLNYNILKEMFKNDNDIKLNLNGSDYDKFKKYSLKFSPEDIAYIVTPDQNDISFIKKEAKKFEDIEFKTW